MSGSHDRLETFRRRYAALRPGWAPATARYQSWVAESLNEGDRILDLGCGRGGIVERLGHCGRWWGVDPDWISLQHHRLPALNRSCARSEALPFAEGTFDIVVASWLLEHLPMPRWTFREVARVLRPNGAFFFLTPNLLHPLPRLSAIFAQMQRLQRRVVALAYRRASADTFPVHYRANTARDVERLAVEAGLHLRRMAYVDDPSYLAFDPLTFAVAVGVDLVLPPGWRVHLVAHFVRM